MFSYRSIAFMLVLFVVTFQPTLNQYFLSYLSEFSISFRFYYVFAQDCLLLQISDASVAYLK